MFRYFIVIISATLLVSSCSKEPVRNYETGQILKVQMGTVRKVNKFVVTRDSAGQGTFAEMASNAAGAITPGIIATGTTRIASATGAMMDSKIETVAKVRVRIEIDPPESKEEPKPAPAPPAEGEAAAPQLAEAKPVKKQGEMVVIIQNDMPGVSFQEGQRVVVSTGSTAGNVWPE